MSRRKQPRSYPVPPEVARFFASLKLPTKAELEKAAAEDEKARQTIRDALAVQMGYQRPPWMDRPTPQDGPKVRAAKVLLADCFPADQWRTMSVTVVHHKLADAAKAKKQPIPSRDSVARAMGRRKPRN